MDPLAGWARVPIKPSKEDASLLRRRRRLGAGALLAVVSAGAGLVLQVASAFAWFDAGAVVAHTAWAAVSVDAFGVTRFYGLRAWVAGDAVAPWSACEANYDAKVAAVEAGPLLTTAEERHVLLGIDAERDECASCAAAADGVVSLALAALPLATMALYCAFVRWTRRRETRTARYLAITASLGTMALLTCAVLRFHAACAATKAVVAAGDGALVAADAAYDWGPGSYLAFVAVALRACDLIVFSVSPIGARAPAKVADDAELGARLLAPPPPPPPDRSPSAWSPTTNALRAATYQSLPFSRED